jgi:hypothetical protein
MAKVNRQTLPFKAKHATFPSLKSLYKFDFHRKMSKLWKLSQYKIRIGRNEE